MTELGVVRRNITCADREQTDRSAQSGAAMAGDVSVLGSMATRGLLAELAAAWDGQADLEATGGVDAARRVREGEVVDVVVLADGAMRKLEADGILLRDSLARIVVSAIAVAVRDGDPLPGLADANAVQRAVLAAGRTGYSTGPSGDHLLRLLAAWGIRDALGDRLVQAPPGVPVGRLLADGAVDLAFQQRSELMSLPGVTVVGPLPSDAQAETVFIAGIAKTAANAEAARRFIAFIASAEAAETKRRHGMEPAAPASGSGT